VGPYDTEQQTRTEPMPTAVRSAARSDPGLASILALDHMVGACADAGVELGTYDRRILEWLAGLEPATVQVVIGLITRAAATKATAEQA
jgi:hypothetical protein